MKDYNINLYKNQNLICIKVWAPVTLQLAFSFTTDITVLGRKLNLSLAFIDLRNTKSNSSVFDKYSFAYKKAEMAGLSRSWRIALLKEEKDTSPDFLETVMLNAGYQFKIFTNEQFALDWLKL